MAIIKISGNSNVCIETDSETFSTINKAVNEYGEAWKARINIDSHCKKEQRLLIESYRGL